MNLHVARTTLQSKPPKRLIEMAAYEVVALLIVAGMMVISI